MCFERPAPENGGFFLKSQEGKCLLGLHVDKFIIAGSSTFIIAKVKLLLSSRLGKNDLGNFPRKVFLYILIVEMIKGNKISRENNRQ